MRVSLFLICALFAFFSSCPSFALDDDEGDVTMLLSNLKNPTVVQSFNKRKDSHKELRNKVQEAVSEIMSAGSVKKTVAIINLLRQEVSGVEEFLKTANGYTRVRRWIYDQRGRYSTRAIKAPAVSTRNGLRREDQRSPRSLPTQLSTRRLSSTITQATDRALEDQLTSLSQSSPVVLQSMILPPIRDESNILPPIRGESNTLPSILLLLPPIASFDSMDAQNSTRITLPPLSALDELDSTNEDLSRGDQYNLRTR